MDGTLEAVQPAADRELVGKIVAQERAAFLLAEGGVRRFAVRRAQVPLTLYEPDTRYLNPFIPPKADRDSAKPLDAPL